ncbi:MAG: nuclear transport factor 2 family protein [Microscillaceae bacterium]|nr:nuclear transport factor 2 family protein [Microscillaceae bacterium]
MATFTVREQIVEVVNKLFVYTDQQDWERLHSEVFAEEVFLDMSSLGGESKTMTPTEICEGWKKGFEGLDAINHLGGNYLVSLQDDVIAQVFAYATATHYKASATKGQTREFVGSYELRLVDTLEGWRINVFKYNLKYTSGNVTLE